MDLSEDELLQWLPGAYDAAPDPRHVTEGEEGGEYAADDLPLGSLAQEAMIRHAGSALFQASLADYGEYADTTVNEQRVARGVVDLPPMNGDSIYIHGSNGLAKWITLEEGEASGMELREAGGGKRARTDVDDLVVDGESDRRLAPSRRGGMLNVSMHSLMQSVQQTIKAEKAAKQRAEAAQNPVAAAATASGSSVKKDEESLWVLKYAPKSYNELLSDEATNLRLLQWLKQWDPYVFGTTKKTSKTSNTDNLLPDAAEGGDLRPIERIALVVGPPGVGKTTLAHVLAKHCGYEVTEVNASADRTVSTLESLISVAVSPLGGNQKQPNQHLHAASSLYETLSRPRCLVIDEMDGIVANVVQILLNQDIHRPVLCLANNLYAPALKELRLAVNTILTVPPINPQRLLLRLEVVTEMEKLCVSRPVLSELAMQSNGDVRCCLNTLQFLRRQGQPHEPSSSSSTVQHMITNLTGKDVSLNIWSLWQEILQKKDRKKYLTLLHADAAAGSEARSAQAAGVPVAKSRVDPGFIYVQSVLDNCVDFETLLDGLFQHYPAQRYSDISLERTRKIARAFSFQEKLTALSYQVPALMQLAELNRAVTAMSCYTYCASTYRMPTFTFPREQQDCILRLRGAESAQQVYSQHPSLAYSLMDRTQIALTIAPLLLRCLYPAGLRIQPTQLSLTSFIGKEQEMARDCTARHVYYKLTYRPKQAGQGGSYDRKVFNSASGGGDGSLAETWVLDPPIHDLGGTSVLYSRQAKAARAARIAAQANSTTASAAGSSSTIIGQSMVPVLALSEHAKQCIAGWGIEVALNAKHQLSNGGPSAQVPQMRPTPQKRPRDNEEDTAGVGPILATSSGAAISRSTGKTPEKQKTTSVLEKRDFFGRVIQSNGNCSTTPSMPQLVNDALLASVAGKQPSGRGPKTPPPPPSEVKYTSYDGCTRGVKIAARLTDFVSVISGPDSS